MSYLSMFPTEVYDAVGVAGFGLYVINYTMLTFDKFRSTQVRYFAVNLAAATMVLISLMSTFNLASAMIQIFWIAISVAAIFIRIRKMRCAPLHTETAATY